MLRLTLGPSSATAERLQPPLDPSETRVQHLAFLLEIFEVVFPRLMVSPAARHDAILR
jgi:hypothetical protein